MDHSELRGQITILENKLPSVPEAEERFSAAEAELASVKQLEATLELTRQFLEAAQDKVHRSIAPVLAATVQQGLARVSGNRYLEVTVDPMDLKVSVRTPEGDWRAATQVSHGTAEQVYLLLRVAMAEHLTARGEVCPLILDDVTVHCDSTRKRALLDVLHVLSGIRQIILFTQEAEVLAWAEEALQSPADNIVHLGAVGAAA